MSDFAKVNEEIAGAVTGAYKKIEDTVVGAYQKVETGAVETYRKVEDACIDTLFAREGETTSQARERLADGRPPQDGGSAQ